jgi:prevent-host-death family protein
MKTYTISEAKAKLGALVEAAERGEEVLIMRGSKPAVTLIPVSEADLALWPAVPASALADFDAEIGRDRRAGQLKPLGRTPATAAKSLKS